MPDKYTKPGLFCLLLFLSVLVVKFKFINKYGQNDGKDYEYISSYYSERNYSGLSDIRSDESEHKSAIKDNKSGKYEYPDNSNKVSEDLNNEKKKSPDNKTDYNNYSYQRNGNDNTDSSNPEKSDSNNAEHISYPVYSDGFKHNPPSSNDKTSAAQNKLPDSTVSYINPDPKKKSGLNTGDFDSIPEQFIPLLQDEENGFYDNNLHSRKEDRTGRKDQPLSNIDNESEQEVKLGPYEYTVSGFIRGLGLREEGNGIEDIYPRISGYPDAPLSGAEPEKFISKSQSLGFNGELVLTVNNDGLLVNKDGPDFFITSSPDSKKQHANILVRTEEGEIVSLGTMRTGEQSTQPFDLGRVESAKEIIIRDAQPLSEGQIQGLALIEDFFAGFQLDSVTMENAVKVVKRRKVSAGNKSSKDLTYDKENMNNYKEIYYE